MHTSPAAAKNPPQPPDRFTDSPTLEQPESWLRLYRKGIPMIIPIDWDDPDLDLDQFPDSWHEPDEPPGPWDDGPARSLFHTGRPGPIAPDPASAAPPQLLTTDQAAQRIQVGRCTMQALVISGEVRSLKIGRLRRIPPEALDEYVANKLAP